MNKLRLVKWDMTPAEWRALAARVGTTTNYLNNLVCKKRPGPLMCRKLVEAEPRIKLHDLRPDLWDEGMS